jgi:hypothetical protein
MATYQYPRSAELAEIAQKLLPVLTMDDPVFKVLPVREMNESLIMWDQKDDYIGLQQIRGLNGQPGRVARRGAKRYIMEPGVYGEFQSIDEMELTQRAKLGTFGERINIEDLVIQATEELLHRRIARIRYIAWTLLSTGTFSVSSPTGGVMHTDTFTTQTFSANVGWSTAATSTPLADFRNVQLLSHGYSVDFDQRATAFMNRQTLNYLLANSNAADLYGRRVAGLATANNLNDVNSILTGDGLPKIEVFDEGYLNDSGTWTQYLANGKVVVVGERRDGAPLGEYLMTANVNSDKGYGSYTTVVDSIEHDNPVPRNITVHDGHNGGPKLDFPSGIVVMSV